MENFELRKPGYESLANAIIESAAADYLRLKKELYLTNSWASANEYKHDLEEVIKFFKSNWYATLTKLPADRLMAKLDEEFEEWKMLDKEFEEWKINYLATKKEP